MPDPSRSPAPGPGTTGGHWTRRVRQVLTPAGVVGPAEVVVADGRIERIAPCAGPGDDVVVAPGFVDLQVNGVDDVDVATAEGDDWARIATLLAAQGTTAWLPTAITAPVDRLVGVLGRISEAMRASGPAVPDPAVSGPVVSGPVVPGPVVPGPVVLGAHLEGPFLGGRHGAHPAEHVVAPDEGAVAALLEPRVDGRPVLRLATLGPEAPGAALATTTLTAAGVAVSIGHTAAGPDDLDAVVDAGARLVTHVWNAQAPLHHRRPGVVGRALLDRRLAVGCIADGVHVHPDVLAITVRALGPGRLVLVTDAVAWRAPRLVAAGVALRDGAPRLPDGTLAGSALTMDGAVRTLVDRTDATLADALVAASTTPARAIGETDRGHLAPGARGDLVVLGADDLEVASTVVAGVVVHER